jgi:hypothetical protein
MLAHAHFVFGFLIALVFLGFANPQLSTSQTNLLLLLGSLIAIIPDFDLFFSFFKTKSLKLHTKATHRKFLSHTPVIWFLIGIIIFFLTPNIFLKMFGLLFWFCSWSHFLGDSIEYGVRWFWPFSKKRFAFNNVSEDDSFYEEKTLKFYKLLFTKVYVKNYTFYIENMIFIFGLAVLIFIMF